MKRNRINHARSPKRIRNPEAELPSPGALLLGLALNRSPGVWHFGTKCPKVKISAEKPAGTGGGIQAPHGKAGRKTGSRPGKAGKAEAAQTKGPIRKAAGAAGWGVHGFVHGKLYEVEQENVGTEGAHRSELAGEVVLRHGSRFVKRKVREHPAKGGQPGRGQVSESGGGLSFPHRRTGAPGAFPKLFYPVLAETAA